VPLWLVYLLCKVYVVAMLCFVLSWIYVEILFVRRWCIAMCLLFLSYFNPASAVVLYNYWHSGYILCLVWCFINIFGCGKNKSVLCCCWARLALSQIIIKGYMLWFVKLDYVYGLNWSDSLLVDFCITL